MQVLCSLRVRFDTFKYIFLFFCPMPFRVLFGECTKWFCDRRIVVNEPCTVLCHAEIWTHLRRILRSVSFTECLNFLWVRSQPCSRKDETKKFTFVFVELALLLVYSQSWGMKSVECAVKSSVMFGLISTKTNNVIGYISCTRYACNDLNGVLEHLAAELRPEKNLL